VEIVHLPCTAAAQEVHEVLERDAAVVVDQLADGETMARIVDEMAPHIEATPYGSDGFSGRTTKRTGD
jgi:hypothetical protein